MAANPTTSVATAPLRRVRMPSGGLTRTPVSLATPEDVLYAGELERGRLWVAMCMVLAFGGLAAAVVFDEPGMGARVAMGAGSGFMLLISAIGLWVLRGERGYSALSAALFGYASLLTFVPACHFFGWCSALVLLVALGGIVFAMGHTTRAVLAMAAAVIVAHGTLGGLIIAGVVPDRGLATLRVDGAFRQIVCLLGCEVLFALSFLIGRQLRRHAHAGVESYGRAIRESARREALLEEARHELERARNLGGVGRYVGLTVGAFELGSVIGRGGMGEVYEATHRDTRQLAAVKVMIVAGAIGSRARQRFEREIGLAARLASPHIVRVLAHSAPGDDLLYLAMERLQGASLADELCWPQRSSRRAMLAMLQQIGRGVDAAHAAGVIHRDLTPRNIFHHTGGGQDVWKVLDFGVSRLTGDGHTLTGAAIVGTPNYMSPEQATSEAIDARSDLFSLGCVAYRCLAGRPAFTGKDLSKVVFHVVHDMPLRPSLVARLPTAVDLVLAIALAKDRDHRFESAAQLAAALEEASRGHISDELERRGAALAALQPWRES